MIKTVENLFELQTLQLKTKINSGERGKEIEALRRKIPPPLLVNFDRALARGKRSIAIVRHGVCGECHIQIPIGVVTSLASREELQRCGNCGRYLYLPPDEPVAAPPPVPAKAVKPGKEAKAPKPAKAHHKKELTHAG